MTPSLAADLTSNVGRERKSSKSKKAAKSAKGSKTKKTAKREMTSGEMLRAATAGAGIDTDQSPKSLTRPEINKFAASALSGKLRHAVGTLSAVTPPVCPKGHALHPSANRLEQDIKRYLLDVEGGNTGCPPPTALNPHEFDPVRQVDATPPEFRAQAAGLVLRHGVRFFGKIPLEKKSILPDLSEFSTWVSSGPPRPVGCPEPAPKGAEFFLAWEQDGRWRHSSPDSEPTETEGLYAVIDAAARTLHELEQTQNPIPKELSDFATKLAELLGIRFVQAPLGLSIIDLAFRHGRSFERSIAFPFRTGDEPWGSDAARFKGWTAIIRHALLRHRDPESGDWPDRKKLLGLIGCTNVDKFNKKSEKAVEFRFEFTPEEITFKKYYNAYDSARKSLMPTDQPQPRKSGKRTSDQRRRGETKRAVEASKRLEDTQKATKAASCRANRK